MNKKALYAVIAVVVVIILVVAVLEVIPTSSSASMTVSVSSTTATAGQSLTFAAFISGGTPSSVVFNFGDGNTGTATHLSGNEYTVTHSYSSAGKYLVTANATVNGKYINNLKSIDEVTIEPAAVSPTIASEITAPSIITLSQIILPGSTVNLTASTLQPPTATNWTIGYYIWNFGEGHTFVNSTIFNTSSGYFMAENVSYLYSTAGIYTVTLGVITFNATNYIPTTYTSNGINYTYYPVSDLKSILSSGNYYNNTYLCTIVVNSNAKLLTSTVPVKNPNEINVVEIQAGGPYSFDPAIDYETVGGEILLNVYGLLFQYNGSSTQLFPMVASEIPTVANGGISANYLNYTIHIRSGLKFANGDPLTVWDVYTSVVRSLLFVTGTPATPDWVVAQDLLPGGGFVPGAESYQNITSAVTVDNATQTVTFHLLKPDPAFLYYLTYVYITDYSWLVAHGAGITFTPAGFAAYMNQGNETDYNTYIQYHTMGSGPYMIKSYLVGQSITLVPNPYYTPIPGVPGYNHTANDTIYIQWEKDPSTGLLMIESGLADIIGGLPTYDYPALSHLASEGKLNITTYPTLAINGYAFNFDINTTMLSTLGTVYSVPQYYFTNLDVRRAFAYAFDYSNYVDNLLGNSKYGADFGFHYTGIIPLGMPGYMNVSQLQQAGAVIPTYNLTIAKEYMVESGEYNISINIPIVVPAGDPVDYAAVQDWAATLNSIDPNIHANALYMESDEIYGLTVPYTDPLPIYFWGWFPDYPFPSDYVVPFLQENSSYPPGDGFTPLILSMAGHPNQSNLDSLMNQYIADAENTGNASLSLKYYDEVEVIGINLTPYVYTYQHNAFYFYSPSIHGSQYEENEINNGGTGSIYIYLSK